MANIVHIRHERSVDVVIAVNEDMFGGFCHVSVYGTKGRLDARFIDSFSAFKTQLQAFVDALRSGAPAVDFMNTVEQMAIIIGGIESREQNSRRIRLDELLP